MKSFVSAMLMIVFFLASQLVSADLIDETCKKTPSYDLCVTTLRSDPGSSKADAQGLARIGALKLQEKATATENQINGLLKGTTDPKLKIALKTCSAGYNVIVKYDVTVAIDGITKGNPKFAEGALIDATREADKCGNGVAGTPVESSNKLVHDLSDVVLAIAKTLL